MIDFELNDDEILSMSLDTLNEATLAMLIYDLEKSLDKAKEGFDMYDKSEHGL